MQYTVETVLTIYILLYSIYYIILLCFLFSSTFLCPIFMTVDEIGAFRFLEVFTLRNGNCPAKIWTQVDVHHGTSCATLLTVTTKRWRVVWIKQTGQLYVTTTSMTALKELQHDMTWQKLWNYWKGQRAETQVLIWGLVQDTHSWFHLLKWIKMKWTLMVYVLFVNIEVKNKMSKDLVIQKKL